MSPLDTRHATPGTRFLAACRREPVDKTPVWLMRQAGRYMPEYRAVKERFGSILDMVKRPDVAAEITMQPIRAFDIDAAIIFADILTLLEGMGLPLEFVRNEGPVIRTPLATEADVAALKVRPAAEALGFTLDAIRLVKRELGGRLPLIGFSGAPFTLACYAIEGQSSRDFLKAKAFMYGQPKAWGLLMEKLSDAVGDYLAAQVEAGADALQLFDSWVGALSPSDYREHVLPWSQRALQKAVAAKRVPLIHFGTGTAGLLRLLREAGGDVIGVDWRIDLADAWSITGNDRAVQGNLDPAILFSSPGEIRKQAGRILDSVKGRPGHIFNLGHGILEHTPVENVKVLVDFVHEYGRC
jgi:uroporphyrinogen decarboxylase